MKLRTEKSTVKKRFVLTNQNTTFKSKLRSNIGKLSALEEPQLLARLLGDHVPSNSFKNIIRTAKKNARSPNKGRNIITSTPHFTRSRANVLFNSIDSSFLSPINNNCNNEKDSSGSNEVHSRQQGAAEIPEYNNLSAGAQAPHYLATQNESVNESEKEEDVPDKETNLMNLIEDIKQKQSKQVENKSANQAVASTSTLETSRNITIGDILSKEEMKERKTNWERLFKKFEALSRQADAREAGSDCSGHSSRNRRFSVESPKMHTSKSLRSTSLLQLVSPYKIGRSVDNRSSVPRIEKEASLHNIIDNIKKTNSGATRKTVNKEIQTSGFAARETALISRTAIVRLSTIRNGMRTRSCLTMIGNSPPPSKNSIDCEEPNIFDSLEPGNELDELLFSDIHDNDLSFVDKPWRFENEYGSREQSDGITPNFIRSEFDIRYGGSSNMNGSDPSTAVNAVVSTPSSRRTTRSKSRVSRKRYSRKKPDEQGITSKADDSVNQIFSAPPVSPSNVTSIPQKNQKATKKKTDRSGYLCSSKAPINQRNSRSTNLRDADLSNSRTEGNNSTRESKKNKAVNNNKRQQFKSKKKKPNLITENESVLETIEDISVGTSPVNDQERRLEVSNNVEEVNSSERATRDGYLLTTPLNSKGEGTQSKESQTSVEIPATTQKQSLRKVNSSRSLDRAAKSKPHKRFSGSLGRVEVELGCSPANRAVSCPALASSSRVEEVTLADDLVNTPSNVSGRFSMKKGESHVNEDQHSSIEMPAPTKKRRGRPGITMPTKAPVYKKKSTASLNRSSLDRTAKSKSHKNQSGLLGPVEIGLEHRPVNQSANCRAFASGRLMEELNGPERATLADDLLETPSNISGRFSMKKGESHVNGDPHSSFKMPAPTKKRRGRPRLTMPTKAPVYKKKSTSPLNCSSFDGTAKSKSDKNVSDLLGRVEVASDSDPADCSVFVSLNHVNEVAGPDPLNHVHEVEIPCNAIARPNRKRDESHVNEEPHSSVEIPPPAPTKKRRGRPKFTNKNRAASPKVTSAHKSTSVNGLTMDGEASNILQKQDNRRSQRTRKPVKHHTDVDIEKLGLIMYNPYKHGTSRADCKRKTSTTAKSRVKKAKYSTNFTLNEPQNANSVRTNATLEEQDDEIEPTDLEIALPPIDERLEQGMRAQSGANGSPQEPDRLNVPTALPDSMNRSRIQDRSSDDVSSSQAASSSTVIDFDRSSRTVLPDDNFVRYVNSGDVYNIRYISRLPPEEAFMKLGNLDVSETINDPENRFSAGYLRLAANDEKRPNVGHKFSFIYSVVSGTADIQLENKRGVVNQGEFFCIPKGLTYSIKNANSRQELLLSYARIKCVDK